MQVHQNWYEPKFSEIAQHRHKSKNQLFHDRVQSIMSARRLTYRDVADLSGLTRTRAREIIEDRIEPNAWEAEQFGIALETKT